MPELELFIVDKNDTSWSMRPWLLLVHHGIPFTETSFIAADPDTPAKIRAVSSAGRVPVLRVGKRFVWESLAIVETLAELHPERSIWPRDAEQRAHARSIAAEMHAGFFELRRYCTMNLALRTRVELDPARRRELDRFERLVEGARGSAMPRGPFLFGDFSAADAMLAPVATRIVSYGLEVGPATRAWIDAVYGLPAFQRWEHEAAAELRVRPLAAQIGAPFAGSVQDRIVAGPCFAVIFSNQRRAAPSDYEEIAQRMSELAPTMPGFLGYESTRGTDGFGITVSYWSSLDAIAGFRAHAEHALAQAAGRERFYATYDLRVARVERHVRFDATKDPQRVEEYV
jgi:glutathione S-transferase